MVSANIADFLDECNEIMQASINSLTKNTKLDENISKEPQRPFEILPTILTRMRRDKFIS